MSQIRRTAQIVTCCGKCSCYVWYSSDAAVLYEKSSVGVPGEADENWWKHQISSTYSTANMHFPWGHLMKWEINTHLWILWWWWWRTHTHTHTHTLSPTASIKSGMLCLNPPLTGCVEELSRAKHLELSEGPQKQGLAAACRLCLYSQDGIDANGAAPQPTTCIISSNALTTRGCLLSHSLEFYSSIVFVRRCSLQPLEKKLRNSRYWHLFILQERKRQGSHPLVIMQRVPLCVATFWKPNHRTKTFIVFDAGLLYCHTLRPIHKIFSSSQI